MKRYHKISKQIERLPKRDLEQWDLTMGELLDTHFPMSGLAVGGGTGTRGRVSANQSDAISLTLHMIWTTHHTPDETQRQKTPRLPTDTPNLATDKTSWTRRCPAERRNQARQPRW